MEEADENEAIVYADIGESCASERPADLCPYLTRRPRDARDHSPKPARHDPEAIRRVPRCCQPQELDARNSLAAHGSHVCNVCSPHFSCMHDVV